MRPIGTRLRWPSTAITAAQLSFLRGRELTRLLGVDLELNAQGMGSVWLDKEA